MKHCLNYLCTLINGCVCQCNKCKLPDNLDVCPKCNYCKHCGRGGEQYVAPILPINPYYGGWYCYTCNVYHPFGYACVNPNWQIYTYPKYTYPIPNTTIMPNDFNTWNFNLNLQGSGSSTVGAIDSNGNNNY